MPRAILILWKLRPVDLDVPRLWKARLGIEKSIRNSGSVFGRVLDMWYSADFLGPSMVGRRFFVDKVGEAR